MNENIIEIKLPIHFIDYNLDREGERVHKGHICTAKPIDDIKVSINLDYLSNLPEDKIKSELYRLIDEKTTDYIHKKYWVGITTNEIIKKYDEEIKDKLNNIILNEKKNTIYLYAHSECLNYDEEGYYYDINPLEKYIHCKKYSDVYYKLQGEHDTGYESLIVKVSKNFIDFMDWKKDIENYEISREEFIKLKNRNYRIWDYK